MDNILGNELRYKAFDARRRSDADADAGSLQPFPPPLVAAAAARSSMLFDQLEPVGFADVWETRMPAETYDQQVISAHDGPGQFLTAAQCNACHNATPQSPLLPKMALVERSAAGASPLRNLSPYGEWRVSPMGLSGRDPIFFSQLQAETNHLPQLTDVHRDAPACTAMARWARVSSRSTRAGRSDAACDDMFAIPPPPEVPFGQPLRRARAAAMAGVRGSGRAVLRRARRATASRAPSATTSPRHDLGEERTYTGNFVTGPADEIYGPYEDDTIVTKPMEHALGLTPMFGEQITSSELCGSCHNVLLPIFDNAGTAPRRELRAGDAPRVAQQRHAAGPATSSAPARTATCRRSTRARQLEFKIANSEIDRPVPADHPSPARRRDRAHRAQTASRATRCTG